MNWVDTISSLVTASATLLLGWLGLRFTRLADRSSAERAIGDLANTMAEMRFEHPEMMGLARDRSPRSPSKPAMSG